MKKTIVYYFSVEGETEYWYLKWLENLINQTEAALKKVKIKHSVQKDPFKYAKKLNILSKTTVYHLSDYESDEPVHTEQFRTTMDRMKMAREQKNIDYKFGYSNLTFDLWIILHMINCNSCISHRKNYIDYINRAFGESFENMNEYKHEGNFKRCLEKLQLSNVIDAINRAKAIDENNKRLGYVLHQYKGYKYYKENPALDVWKPIDEMLKTCGLL